jgi:hypothetical protein
VTLRHDGLRTAGFQIAARLEDGTQAGALLPDPDDAGRTDVTAADGIQYAHHSYPGSRAGNGVARWSVTWKAPDALTPVSFNAAAVAGDDDISPLGDFVYVAARTVCTP